jgi:hypothetical protein
MMDYYGNIFDDAGNYVGTDYYASQAWADAVAANAAQQAAAEEYQAAEQAYLQEQANAINEGREVDPTGEMAENLYQAAMHVDQVYTSIAPITGGNFATAAERETYVAEIWPEIPRSIVAPVEPVAPPPIYLAPVERVAPPPVYPPEMEPIVMPPLSPGERRTMTGKVRLYLISDAPYYRIDTGLLPEAIYPDLVSLEELPLEELDPVQFTALSELKEYTRSRGEQRVRVGSLEEVIGILRGELPVPAPDSDFSLSEALTWAGLAYWALS